MDTRDPDNVSGSVNTFWEKLVSNFGEEYGTTVSLEWVLFDTSNDALTALYNGEVDADCGNWVTNADWVDPDTGASYARALAFSTMHCPLWYSQNYVYTLAGSVISSISSLVKAIEASQNPVTVCVTNDENRYALHSY